jgi:hypothetical protein
MIIKEEMRWDLVENGPQSPNTMWMANNTMLSEWSYAKAQLTIVKMKLREKERNLSSVILAHEIKHTMRV